MWHQALTFAPHIAIAAAIVLGVTLGVLCHGRLRLAGSGFFHNFISSTRESTSSVLHTLWSAIAGQRAARHDVIVHDPDASKPHDLDDPFFDRKVQERIGAAISRAVRKDRKSVV